MQQEVPTQTRVLAQAKVPQLVFTVPTVIDLLPYQWSCACNNILLIKYLFISCIVGGKSFILYRRQPFGSFLDIYCFSNNASTLNANRKENLV